MSSVQKAFCYDDVAAHFMLLCELPTEIKKAKLHEIAVSNSSLAKELEELLILGDQTDSFLDRSEEILAQALLSTTENIEPGSEVGDFRIEERLGNGAFGAVYRAHQKSLRRTVAVKLTPNLGLESRTLAPLEHPNIVRIFSESSLESGSRLLCLQYIPGISLEALLKLNPNPPSCGAALLELLDAAVAGNQGLLPSRLAERADFAALSSHGILLSWIEQIAGALAYAHDRGVLHLDVKPGNILIDVYGKAWLTDFNVAFEKNSPDSHQTLFGGTEQYMSPEQQAAFLDPRPERMTSLSSASDLYSLAKVASEMQEKWLPGNCQLPCLEESLAQEPSQRPSAIHWQIGATNSLAIRQALASVGSAPFLGRWIEREPRWALVLGVLIPQFIGSLVNIVYNGTQIVDWLDGRQREVFGYLCLAYNPLIFFLGTFLLFPQINPIFRTPYNRRTSAKEFRQILLRFPSKALWIPCTLWVCSFLVFPFGIHFLASPLPNAMTYVHFFLSFLFAALVSGTYSYLLCDLILMRAVYPNLWWGEERLAVVAPTELKGQAKTLRTFSILAGALPIVGAASFIFTNAEEVNVAYRWLMLVLMATGILGFGLAIRIQNYLERFFQRLTGGM